MDNNQDEVIEKYLQDREQEDKTKEIQINPELAKKKDYLKRHVVDQYMNNQAIMEDFAQFFLNYLKEKKGIETEEHDLGLLSFGEIEEVVANFRLRQVKRKQRFVEEEKPQPEPTSFIDLVQMVVPPQSWNPKKVYYANGAWDYELSGYQECKRQKPYFGKEINPKSTKISFGKVFTKKRGGFFGIGGTLQLWIQIKTIERTVEDFIFLRNALRRAYPHTFIPSLEITQKQLGKIDNQGPKVYIMNECHKFINSIIKIQSLYQNIYTFRFFRQQKYDNYTEHKKNFTNHLVNHIKLLKNIDGTVPIEISELNQQIKKDYSRKSQRFDTMWRTVGQSNSKIIQSLKDIQRELSFQKKQFSTVLTQLTTSKISQHSECYQKISEILFCYNDVYNIYGQNLKHYQELFEGINGQLTQQVQRNWKNFMEYRKEIIQFNQEYQTTRKVFLEKEMKNVKETESNCKEIQTLGKKDEKPFNPNLSVIIELGIDNTNQRQFAWIERYSKWQAYINKQFTKSFEKLVEDDRDILVKILQNKAQKILESGHREQQSLIKHVNAING